MADIYLQPKQAELYEMYEYGRPRKIGAGGSRGGSKSMSADMIMLLRRAKYPGTNGLFVMKVYQDMLDIHIRPLLQSYPELEDCFNRQDMILNLPKGSTVRFLSGDNLNEFKKRKGRGFADIIVDQSELFSQEEIEFLATINRSVDTKITPKMLLCFNPGGVSHAYNKRVFIQKQYEKNEDPEDYGFVQIFGWDNAFWSQKQLAAEGLTIRDYHSWDSEKRFKYFILSDYGRLLDQLPENQRKAELLGDFDVFEGMFFSDFRSTHHIIDNYEYKQEFSSIGGLDYGRVTCFHLLQRDFEGTIIACGEVYLNNIESPGQRANLIADFLIERKIWNLEIIYDTDMDISQISNVGYDKKPIDIFRQVFNERMGDYAPIMTVISKHSVERNKTWRSVVNDAVKEYLHINPETKKSSVYFTKDCIQLIKFLGEAIYDPDDSSGQDFYRKMVPKTDHPFDSFKHGFIRLYTPTQKVTSNLPPWAKDIGIYDEEDEEDIIPHSVMGL